MRCVSRLIVVDRIRGQTMFTKKHYKAIAEIVVRARKNPNLATVDGHCRQIASDLANYFATDNPRFDRDKFLSACGL